jgi:hypothetical protein
MYSDTQAVTRRQHTIVRIEMFTDARADATLRMPISLRGILLSQHTRNTTSPHAHQNMYDAISAMMNSDSPSDVIDDKMIMAAAMMLTAAICIAHSSEQSHHCTLTHHLPRLQFDSNIGAPDLTDQRKPTPQHTDHNTTTLTVCVLRRTAMHFEKLAVRHQEQRVASLQLYVADAVDNRVAMSVNGNDRRVEHRAELRTRVTLSHIARSGASRGARSVWCVLDSHVLSSQRDRTQAPRRLQTTNAQYTNTITQTRRHKQHARLLCDRRP